MANKIKIGIDIQATKGRGSGLSVYTKSLVQAMKRRCPSTYDMQFYAKSDEKNLNTLTRLFWENWELPRLAKQDQVQLLHVPAFCAPYQKIGKLVLTVHDLIGMLFPNQLGIPSAFYWGKWLPKIISRADAIIADSKSTKKDLMQHLNIKEEKIHVIYASGHEGFSDLRDSQKLISTKERFDIRNDYFLCVGTIEPRKNIKGVLKAFNLFKRQTGSAHQLVIVGSQDFARGKAYRLLLEENDLIDRDLIFTGYISHEDLNLLYSGASSFIFPSFYEGFGMPVLEAMASGTPVITSNRTSLPEVAGDAAYLVSPDDENQIASAMSQIAQQADLRNRFIQKGFEQIKQFSWDRAAEETMEVYEKVLVDSNLIKSR